MNYSDFENIEQDEWSLTRPTFPTPKGGMLTVVGWSGRNGWSAKYYVVECNLCSNNRELNGDGVYKAIKSNLHRGSVPCSCSKQAKLTKCQWEAKVKKASEEKGLKFISFVGEYIGCSTRVKVCCPKHGTWDSLTASEFVNSDRGCPTCGYHRGGEALLKETGYHLAEFMATGKFHRGTEFWRSERKDLKGTRKYWFYKCPVCSEDEYAKAGLCDGIFEASCGNMKRGKLSCRCSKSPKYNENQWTYRLEKETEKNGHTLIKWLEKPGNSKKFQYICPHHGEQVAHANNYLSGKGCPLCAGKNQRQCYINQVFDENLVVALKFGIAKESERRVRVQNAKNLFRMEQMGVWEFPSVKSCKAAEKQCKKELDCRILTKRELSDGWTETTYIKNLDRVIEIYENHDGKRISAKEER